jgi:hypothetical protein
MSTAGDFPIDTSKPHTARMYDYYMGGKDWFPADQEAAEAVKKVFPFIVTGAKANRDFMHRATHTLATEYGIRQFIDIGTGIPTEPNLHQVAQAAAPDCRVVYADHDPTVLDYADALMRSSPEGATAYIHGDVRYDDILNNPKLRETLDLSKPVALSLIAVVHFIPDEDKPVELVRRLVDELAPGSFLTLSHATPDFDPGDEVEKAVQVYRDGGTPAQVRKKHEVLEFFKGLELIEPGLTPSHRWRPDAPSEMTDQQAFFYAGVARKP